MRYEIKISEIPDANQIGSAGQEFPTALSLHRLLRPTR